MSYVLSLCETRNCCVHRETVLCALQGFQIKQMIFFHSKRVSAMRNIIQNGLFVIQKNVYTFFIFIFTTKAYSCWVFYHPRILKICWQQGRLSKFVHNNCFIFFLPLGATAIKKLMDLLSGKKDDGILIWTHFNSPRIKALNFFIRPFCHTFVYIAQSCSHSS